MLNAMGENLIADENLHNHKESHCQIVINDKHNMLTSLLNA